MQSPPLPLSHTLAAAFYAKVRHGGAANPQRFGRSASGSRSVADQRGRRGRSRRAARCAFSPGKSFPPRAGRPPTRHGTSAPRWRRPGASLQPLRRPRSPASRSPVFPARSSATRCRRPGRQRLPHVLSHRRGASHHPLLTNRSRRPGLKCPLQHFRVQRSTHRPVGRSPELFR